MLLTALKEVYHIFKISPSKISFIWFLDILQVCINVSTHIFIGLAIDGLIYAHGDMTWMYVLIGIELTFLIIAWLNRYYDTRVYSKVKQILKEQYYNKNAGPETLSTTTSRLSLAENAVEFLEFDIYQIISTFLSLVVALGYVVYLSHQSTYLLFVWVIFFLTVSLFLCRKARSLCITLKIRTKDADEEEHDIIDSLNNRKYHRYLTKRRMLDIAYSDSDAKIFAVMRGISIISLIGAILLVISFCNKVSAGFLYTAITYIYNLNDDALDVNDHIIDIANFNDNAARLKHLENA